jgi:hypothetical protein
MDITLVTFAILALAAFRLTHLVTTDAIADTFRTWVWKKFPPMTKIGYLITCNWCTGFWVSLLIATGFFLLPQVTLVVSLVLALSGVVGLLSAWIER